MLARENCRRTGESHNQVRLGMIGEGGSDVVNNRFLGSAHKPRWTDDNLNEVHGPARALVEIYAEIGSEGINHQSAAIERLQHQDLPDRGLSFARGHTERQATRQHRTLESAI